MYKEITLYILTLFMATSEAMKRAKAKYYEKNKEKIAAKRNEYYESI
jgi:hypothetical protein